MRTTKEKKDIIKASFINSAKYIIENEGYEKLNARNIGEKSGYSYATIYNYFENLNDLIICISSDYLYDIHQISKKAYSKGKNGLEKIINAYNAYVKFFLENENIYQLLFRNNLGKDTERLFKSKKVEKITKERRKLIIASLKDSIKTNDEEILYIDQLILITIQGVLSFYFTNGLKDSKNEVLSLVNKNINYIVNKKNKNNY